MASVIRYGEDTRTALRKRFSRDQGNGGRIIETADGPMTLADAISWLADHSAHHLRQIYWLMQNNLGIRPEDPLDLTALPAMVVFLASPRASYITGQSILVDGGLVRAV